MAGCWRSTPRISRSPAGASGGFTASPASMPAGQGRAGSPSRCPLCSRNQGAEGTYRRFKFEIQAIARRNDLPGIDLSLELTGREPALRMNRRADAPRQGVAARPKAGTAAPAQPPAKSMPLFHVLGDDMPERIRRTFRDGISTRSRPVRRLASGTAAKQRDRTTTMPPSMASGASATPASPRIPRPAHPP